MQEALAALDGTCCLGTINDCNLDPTDATQLTAVLDIAFPDGLLCQCSCAYIYDQCSMSIYMNCSGNINDADAWCSVCGAQGTFCSGHLTTVDLTPATDDASRLLANEEAFPNNGLDGCEEAVMVLENGSRCWSLDEGATWTCAGGAASGSRIFLTSGYNRDIAPLIEARTDDGRTGFPVSGDSAGNLAYRAISLWAADTDNDGLRDTFGAGTLTAGNMLNDPDGLFLDGCVSTAVGHLDVQHTFQVTTNGWYRWDIQAVGTAPNTPAVGGVGSFFLQIAEFVDAGNANFVDDIVVYQSPVEGLGDESRDRSAINRRFNVYLEAGRCYYLRTRNLTQQDRGGGYNGTFEIQYLGDYAVTGTPTY